MTRALVTALGLGLGLGSWLLACDRADGTSGNAAAATATCPPCECACDCAEGETSAGQAGAEPSPELSDLMAAASREMAHGNGAACLANLDRAVQLDPKFEPHVIMVRAQCRMLIGECQEPKQIITDWYMREQAFTRELAERTAESIASMRCRGGDASERDRLRAALFDLSDGAYMNKRDVAFCKDRVAIAEELGAKVGPRDVEDTQISGGMQALFHASAMCFARAGDCKTAYAYYRRLFPREGLHAIKDAQMREQVVRESFDSSIALCQPTP